MVPPSRSFSLTDLSWTDVRAHLAHDSRLLVPVGACDQYGPHLPIGSATLVAESIATELAREFGVLQAPAVPYGVNLRAERPFEGTASLREKTLHGLLNDLLASWEDHGFTEFILLTAHDHDPHVESIAAITGTTARIRVLELLSIDFSDLLEDREGPEHGGELLTSLMLYLHPDKVNMAAVEDYPAIRLGLRSPRARIDRLPADSLGTIGTASLASAEKGRAVHDRILRKIRERLFLADPEEET